jgi:hypothetical protein
VEIFGRRPRVKSAEQILSGLQALYDSGYRGSLFFVDDNFIGNRKAVGELLPKIAEWQAQRGWPFELVYFPSGGRSGLIVTQGAPRAEARGRWSVCDPPPVVWFGARQGARGEWPTRGRPARQRPTGRPLETPCASASRQELLNGQRGCLSVLRPCFMSE